MRILGFLFVIVLVLAGVGYLRGWFSISTTHAAGHSDVVLQLDKSRISDDAAAAGSRLGQLSTKAAAAVTSLGRKVSADESDLEGTLVSVDSAARDLTLTAGSETIEMHVPIGVPIARSGISISFDELRPTTRVRLAFRHAGATRSLSRIEIMP